MPTQPWWSAYLKEPATADTPVAGESMSITRPSYGCTPTCATARPSSDPLPLVSIILQYYRMAPNIDALSKWKSECGDGIELIVNVDSREFGDLKWLDKLADAVVFSSPPLHEVRAYNRLARMARAEIVAFVQDDAPPPLGCAWMEHMQRLFSSDMALAAVGWNQWSAVPPTRMWVGASSSDDDGGSSSGSWRGQHQFKWHYTARSRWPAAARAQGLAAGPPQGLHVQSRASSSGGAASIAANYAAVVDIGPLFVRRSTFLAIGGFDEGFSEPGRGAIGACPRSSWPKVKR